MTMPCYKKRPKWWMTLLEIFHITERQYWTVFLYTIALIISVTLVKEYFSNSPINDYLLKYSITSLATTPFGYYWVQHTLNKNLADDWFKNFIVNEQAVWILSALFSPIIFIGVLIKHYFKK